MPRGAPAVRRGPSRQPNSRPAVGQQCGASEVMTPSADHPAGGAQQQQDQADHEDDDPDPPENRDLEQQAEKQQYQSEDDHLGPPKNRAAAAAAAQPHVGASDRGWTNLPGARVTRTMERRHPAGGALTRRVAQAAEFWASSGWPGTGSAGRGNAGRRNRGAWKGFHVPSGCASRSVMAQIEAGW